ncbi:MAG: glucose-1-phosphate cytidylyltransferase [Candidatus Giovannonibacteria bacterium]|nr:glucose-1-phosphate cytidylyltransferase [Candidatus Giovannonibacteria bacterium]
MLREISQIPVVILCGGRGTRLKEETEFVPKPLVKIGEKPILWHIMKIYYAQGFKKFVLLLGYKGYQIKEYFHQYPIYHSDFTMRQGKTSEIIYHNRPDEDWEVTFVDTGLDTQTGGRIKKAEKFLKDGAFMLTYGDCLANVDLQKLLESHYASNKLATVTGVYPPGRFGEMVVSGGDVVSFAEKPPQSKHINGGFFVLGPKIFTALSGDPLLNFEKHVLPKLAEEKQLALYAHPGYWQCMDTLHDMELLNEEWQRGSASWKIWAD